MKKILAFICLALCCACNSDDAVETPDPWNNLLLQMEPTTLSATEVMQSVSCWKSILYYRHYDSGEVNEYIGGDEFWDGSGPHYFVFKDKMFYLIMTGTANPNNCVGQCLRIPFSGEEPNFTIEDPRYGTNELKIVNYDEQKIALEITINHPSGNINNDVMLFDQYVIVPAEKEKLYEDIQKVLDEIEQEHNN